MCITKGSKKIIYRIFSFRGFLDDYKINVGVETVITVHKSN
jgi:hypothetical protein